MSKTHECRISLLSILCTNTSTRFVTIPLNVECGRGASPKGNYLSLCAQQKRRKKGKGKDISEEGKQYTSPSTPPTEGGRKGRGAGKRKTEHPSPPESKDKANAPHNFYNPDHTASSHTIARRRPTTTKLPWATPRKTRTFIRVALKRKTRANKQTARQVTTRPILPTARKQKSKARPTDTHAQRTPPRPPKVSAHGLTTTNTHHGHAHPRVTTGTRTETRDP